MLSVFIKISIPVVELGIIERVLLAQVVAVRKLIGPGLVRLQEHPFVGLGDVVDDALQVELVALHVEWESEGHL